MEITKSRIGKLRKQIKNLRVEIRKIDLLLSHEEQFQTGVLEVLKDEKAKLILLKKRSDPLKKLVLLRLKGKTTLQKIEDILYTTPNMKNLDIYLLKFSVILKHLALQAKLFKRHMMHEDFQEMDWDVATLRKLQQILDPSGYLYVGSTVEMKIASIINYLYDGTTLHYSSHRNKKLKNNNNNSNNFGAVNNNIPRRRKSRRNRRNSIA